jgi:thiol-disulfide isomerase/thioredoxin
MTGALAAIVILAASAIFGVIWRRRDGVLVDQRSKTGAPAPRPAGGVPGVPGVTSDGRYAPGAPGVPDAPHERMDAGDLGIALGPRATLVQFSTAFCAPCRATRTILAEVARTVDGVVHVEIDAESRLELVRRLRVLRTPTVLVLDAGGRIASRGSGRPRKADVIAALGKAIAT